MFCDVICKAVIEELKSGNTLGNGDNHIDISEEVGQLMKLQEKLEVPPHDHEEHALGKYREMYHNTEFYDDTTGKMLDKELVTRARKTEMDFFKKMKVYTKVHRSQADKIISVRWIDINKGDSEKPDYRSRLVGREINRDKEKREDLFAATPPLESLKYIISKCASNQKGKNKFVIMSTGIKRAYFFVKATRPVYIEIPSVDREAGDEDPVGLLNLS